MLWGKCKKLSSDMLFYAFCFQFKLSNGSKRLNIANIITHLKNLEELFPGKKLLTNGNQGTLCARLLCLNIDQFYWVTYLINGFKVIRQFHFYTFCRQFVLCPYSQQRSSICCFFVVMPVSIVTIIYVHLWSKSKLYWMVWLTNIKSVNNTFRNTFFYLDFPDILKYSFLYFLHV